MPAERPIAKQVADNPYLFIPVGEVPALFGFGSNVVTKLIAMGAPVVAKKMNPRLLMEWLAEHAGEVGKIRED